MSVPLADDLFDEETGLRKQVDDLQTCEEAKVCGIEDPGVHVTPTSTEEKVSNDPPITDVRYARNDTTVGREQRGEVTKHPPRIDEMLEYVGKDNTVVPLSFKRPD
jgi:hypothetical protein